MTYTVFLDMDGPLADFATRCADVLGRPEHGTFGRLPPHDHDSTYATYGFADQKEFWSAIHAGGAYEFWRRIRPMPWASLLYSNLLRHPLVDEVVVLSSPARPSACAMAKVEWLQDHLGGLAPFRDWILCPSQHKHYLAGPNRILIDDYPRNVWEFGRSGGRSILFPLPWNAAGSSLVFCRDLHTGADYWWRRVVKPVLEQIPITEDA